jgi:hypothetical protein
LLEFSEISIAAMLMAKFNPYILTLQQVSNFCSQNNSKSILNSVPGTTL